jgi:hypothetical protein
MVRRPGTFLGVFSAWPSLCSRQVETEKEILDPVAVDALVFGLVANGLGRGFVTPT